MFVWILFIFHLDLFHAAKSKIKPPKMLGKKTGVFATRSPHRPNPIGLSMGRVVSLSSTLLTLSGIDLVDQTPIIDLKPYIPQDFVAESDLILPEWISAAS
jgi:tRNA-Thr(GGU) m(6)t(6)A37 methyltransferase TsaA